MKKRWLRAAVLGFSLFAAALAGAGTIASAPRNAGGREQSSAATQTNHRPTPQQEIIRPIESQEKVTAYTLPPDLYRKAKTLGQIHFALNLIDAFYGIVVFWLVLKLGWAPKFRDWAERVSKNRFVQAFVFTPALMVLVAALQSPLAIYEHLVSTKYGLSVESWGALAWDWTKGILIFMVIGGFMVWILYGV